jgi:4a-hydroxytetrahydrobiopterin dehydratase
VTQALDELPGWDRIGDAILEAFDHDDHRSAMQFVNRVADAAEPANNHPGIQIRRNQVTRAHQP